MRISHYPTDTLTGTEMILASNVDTSTQKYKTVNFTVDTLKTFLVGTEDTNQFTNIVLGGSLIFEGTANAHETTLGAVDPTADRAINLPNVAGTLPVLAAVSATAITATPEELNILDTVTATAAELNILDGVTSTAAELNYLDITALGTVEASKVVTADANGDITIPGASSKQMIWDKSDGALEFNDDALIKFGTGGDLKIWHQASNNHSYIHEAGSGTLIIRGTDVHINNADDTENMITAVANGAVTLFCDHEPKLATTSTGISVTGTITSTLGITGTTGTFSGAVTGASYTGGAISGTTGTFSGDVTLSSTTPQLHLTNTGTAASNWVSFNTSAGRQGFVGQGHAGQQIGLYADNAEVIISSYGTAALTLGASQAATFAGTVKATQFKQAALDTEPGASSTGTVGDIKISDTHIYVCTAADTWKRAELTGGY